METKIVNITGVPFLCLDYEAKNGAMNAANGSAYSITDMQPPKNEKQIRKILMDIVNMELSEKDIILVDNMPVHVAYPFLKGLLNYTQAGIYSVKYNEKNEFESYVKIDK